MSTPFHIRRRLAAGNRFTLAEVRQWMADEGDLELWSAIYHLLGPGWQLIRPEPDMEETCEFLTRYLLRCIHENVLDDDHIPTGYEAAGDLASCLKLWATKLPATQSVLSHAEREITTAYLTADDAERDRLLNGTLEHALEAVAIRPYFAHWKDDPALDEPWRIAMEWALAHTDPPRR